MKNTKEKISIQELSDHKEIQDATITYYYRTRSGAEIDLVLERAFGILLIEIKLGTTTTARQLTSLQKFIKDYDLAYGVVINNSKKVMCNSRNLI